MQHKLIVVKVSSTEINSSDTTKALDIAMNINPADHSFSHSIPYGDAGYAKHVRTVLTPSSHTGLFFVELAMSRASAAGAIVPVLAATPFGLCRALTGVSKMAQKSIAPLNTSKFLDPLANVDSATDCVATLVRMHPCALPENTAVSSCTSMFVKSCLAYCLYFHRTGLI